MKNDIIYLQNKAYNMRKRFLDLFTNIGFGHVTSAFSWTEIACVLYYEIMNYDCKNPLDKNRDRIVVSKGHGVGMLFPIFEDVGLVKPDYLDSAIKINGINNSELNKLFYPGFDFYGGSLGMGLGMACGLAKGAKLDNNSWKTYCIVGDAECYEGSIWEAAMFAGHNKLNNLITIIDRNSLGCSDFTEHMLELEPFEDKWKAFGWSVINVDGHDFEQLYDAITTDSDRPLCVIAHTIKGKGLPSLYNKPLLHGYMPKGEEIEKIYDELAKNRYE